MKWEIPDSEIDSACETEFDGQDKFLIVQEILEARKQIGQLQTKNKWLKDGIELAIDYLTECPDKAKSFLEGTLKGENKDG